MLSPGQEFPNFVLPSVIRDLATVDSAELKGIWKLYIFLEPNQGTIGTVEFNYLIELRAAFEKRGIKALGVISDGKFFRSYLEDCAKKEIEPPLAVLDDSDGGLGKAAGVPMPQRASFLVDPTDIVRYVCSYDAPYPMNVFSILAIYDLLHFDPVKAAWRSYTPQSGSKPS